MTVTCTKFIKIFVNIFSRKTPTLLSRQG